MSRLSYLTNETSIIQAHKSRRLGTCIHEIITKELTGCLVAITLRIKHYQRISGPISQGKMTNLETGRGGIPELVKESETNRCAPQTFRAKDVSTQA